MKELAKKLAVFGRGVNWLFQLKKKNHGYIYKDHGYKP